MLTHQQKIIRQGGIGGSDAAQILGKSRWGTAYNVYKSKIAESIEEEEYYGQYEAGNDLEPLVVKKYMKATGNEVICGDATIVHPKHDFILANIDGFIPKLNRVFEAKAPIFYDDKWGDAGSSDIPLDYFYQVMHYCNVMNADGADIAVIFRFTWDFIIFKYEHNKKRGQQLLDVERKFWEDHVEKRIPPAITNINDAKEEFSNTADSETMADQLIISKVKSYDSITAKQKSLKDAKDVIKTDILKYMRESTRLTDSEGKLLLTYNNETKSKLDSNKLKIDHPDIYKKYNNKSESRVIRTKH